MFMHPDNPEFQRQLATRFGNPDSYKKILKKIKRRPELAPHFLLNGKNLDGFVAGESSFDRLVELGGGRPVRSSSVDDSEHKQQYMQPRPSLQSPSLIDQIDFKQLGKSEHGIQLPSQGKDFGEGDSKRAFSDSSACRSSTYLRYTFDSCNLQGSSDNDRLRNFKPNNCNKNVSNIGLTLDNLNTVWKRRNKYDHKSRVEQAPVTFNIPNYFFKGRVLWTHQEYISVQKIQNQYRVH